MTLPDHIQRTGKAGAESIACGTCKAFTWLWGTAEHCDEDAATFASQHRHEARKPKEKP